MSTERARQTWNIKGLRTRYVPKSRLGQGMVSMAPWLDFVLLLLLFGLLQSKLVLQPGIVVSLPDAPFSEGTEMGLVAVILSVSTVDSNRDGAIVFFDDERFVIGNEAQMQGFARSLAARLKEHPDAPLVIQADRDIAQGTVVEIIDIASGVGVKQVNVAVRPQ